MNLALSIVVELALVWAAVVKLLHLRRSPDDRPLRAVAGICVCLALAPVPTLPGVKDLVEGIMPGLAKLLLNLVTVTATYFLMDFFGSSVGGPGPAARLRRLRAGLLVAQAVMTVAWATAPERIRVGPADLGNLDDRHSAVFSVAALGFMGYGLTYAFAWAVGYARAAHRVRLRTSLRIVAVALAALLIACLTKAGVALALGLVGSLHPDDPAIVAVSRLWPPCVLIGTLLLVTGFCYPAVASLPGRVRRSRERRQLYRRLGPLWHRMRSAFPHLVLAGPRWAGLARNMGWMPWTYRAYFRRVIEIRDTIVQLAPYYDPEVVRRARDQVGEDEIRVCALLMADALRRKGAEKPVEKPFVLPLLGGDDLDSDARWLAGLATELERVADQPAESSCSGPVSSDAVSSEPVPSSTSSIRST